MLWIFAFIIFSQEDCFLSGCICFLIFFKFKCLLEFLTFECLPCLPFLWNTFLFTSIFLISICFPSFKLSSKLNSFKASNFEHKKLKNCSWSFCGICSIWWIFKVGTENFFLLSSFLTTEIYDAKFICSFL